MSLDFNADEILQMAQRIERNGVNFYRRAAKGTIEPGSAQLLLKLAAMEEGHEKIFARMRAELTEAEGKKRAFDPEDQATAYLRAWADVQVFDVRTDPAEKADREREGGRYSPDGYWTGKRFHCLLSGNESDGPGKAGPGQDR